MPFQIKIQIRKIKRAPWRTTALENDGAIKYNVKPNDPEYFKKYYEENKEIIKEKARIYSRDKYYPLHKEEKIKSVKKYQAKKRDQEYIFFPKTNKIEME